MSFGIGMFAYVFEFRFFMVWVTSYMPGPVDSLPTILNSIPSLVKSQPVRWKKLLFPILIGERILADIVNVVIVLMC